MEKSDEFDADRLLEEYDVLIRKSIDQKDIARIQEDGSIHLAKLPYASWKDYDKAFPTSVDAGDILPKYIEFTSSIIGHQLQTISGLLNQLVAKELQNEVHIGALKTEIADLQRELRSTTIQMQDLERSFHELPGPVQPSHQPLLPFHMDEYDQHDDNILDFGYAMANGQAPPPVVPQFHAPQPPKDPAPEAMSMVSSNPPATQENRTEGTVGWALTSDEWDEWHHMENQLLDACRKLKIFPEAYSRNKIYVHELRNLKVHFEQLGEPPYEDAAEHCELLIDLKERFKTNLKDGGVKLFSQKS